MHAVKRKALRLAMWSGPRNISTAMMRAWENREDTVVWDEPLYAYYLDQTGRDHPGAEEIIAAGEPNLPAVIRRATGAIPAHRSIFFQKHMTHHLLDTTSWEWLSGVTNWFLIRDPTEVITSYLRVRAEVTAEDIGIPQQAKIFDYVRQKTGHVPPVLDAREVLLDPRAQLEKLCSVLQVPFSEKMLAWPPRRA